MNRDLIRRVLTGEVASALPANGGPWTQVYGRNAPAGIELVYEGPRGGVGARVVTLPVAGGPASVRKWLDDPALPALQYLRQRGHNARPVRYRPNKRCTLRMADLFLKCVTDDRGSMINRDARLLWQASRDGQLGFGVARPAGWLPSLKVLAQHRVPGAPVVERLASPAGCDLARSLGAANASLANASIPVAARFTYADQLRRTAKYARRLETWVPGAGQSLAKLLPRLADIEPGTADRPIHGAPHAHQWLDGPDGPMLVDFDRFSLGDPELDAATFAAEADFEESPHFRQAGDAFVAGYDANFALNLRLLLAYRVHKHVAKALRTATAIRLDAGERSLAILRNANRLLEQGA